MCPNMLQGSYEGTESKSEVDAKAILLTHFLFFPKASHINGQGSVDNPSILKEILKVDYFLKPHFLDNWAPSKVHLFRRKATSF